ncbi:hypothetical protein J0A67_17260 [Algoriphagus aestuariicola]|uniref:Uncharacterized protein n=1 Tax=Algoriphagus aestuariicola TaxID=1852016 RepID=A0ABS3BU21_9BACT|nr:hypothetical protein [Algoriphagus aestuariicola]MBN7802628.1 hypothetical protein [Algoriphagus aestuariicola]
MAFDFSKLSPLSIMTLVMAFFVTVSAGALFLFVYSRELFLSVDSFKLCLLSFGITSPFWIVNTIPHFFWEGAGNADAKIDSPLIACLSGCIWTVPVVYSPIISSLFWQLNFRNALLMMLAVGLVVFVILNFIEGRSGKKVAL